MKGFCHFPASLHRKKRVATDRCNLSNILSSLRSIQSDYQLRRYSQFSLYSHFSFCFFFTTKHQLFARIFDTKSVSNHNPPMSIYFNSQIPDLSQSDSCKTSEVKTIQFVNLNLLFTFMLLSKSIICT